jgi:hypothetical protein
MRNTAVMALLIGMAVGGTLVSCGGYVRTKSSTLSADDTFVADNMSCIALCSSKDCIDAVCLEEANKQPYAGEISVCYHDSSSSNIRFSPCPILVPDEALDNFLLLFVARNDSDVVASVRQTCSVKPPVIIAPAVLDQILAAGRYRLLVFHNLTLIGETDYLFAK